MIAHMCRRRIVDLQLPIPPHSVFGLLDRRGLVHGDDIVEARAVGDDIFHIRARAIAELGNRPLEPGEPALIVGIGQNVGAGQSTGLAEIVVGHQQDGLEATVGFERIRVAKLDVTPHDRNDRRNTVRASEPQRGDPTR